MIRTLTGTITDIGDNWVVVDVRGVGYLVGCPTLANNFTLEQSVKLQTYLAVRETALDLYGFPEKSELQMFELFAQRAQSRTKVCPSYNDPSHPHSS